MKNIYIIAFIIVFAINCYSQSKTTVYKDKTGKMIGFSTTSGNTTVYKDKNSKTQMIKTEYGNTAIYRDHKGKTIMTETNNNTNKKNK